MSLRGGAARSLLPPSGGKEGGSREERILPVKKNKLHPKLDVWTIRERVDGLSSILAGGVGRRQLEQGVATIITAFTPFRFFAETPIFSVSLSSFRLSPIQS